MAKPWIKVGIVLALLLCAAALGAEQEEIKPADKPAAKQATGESPAEENSMADKFAVPAGTPQELMEYIDKILQTPPENEAEREKSRKAILQAAEKILAANPEEQELEFAVDLKMQLLDKLEDVNAFAEALKKAGHKKQARKVRGFVFQVEMRKAILNGEKDLKKMIEKVIDYLRESPPQASDLNLAIMVGQIAEHLDDNAYAIDIYRQLGNVFGASPDERLAEFAKKLTGVVRRLSLLGQKMLLDGNLLSGEKFDFAKYQGKVVLVDFWTTWCGPCRAEMPNLKKNYEAYHDKGFEILGFSCDLRREALEKYLQDNDIPWVIVYGDDGPSPTVDYYGVYVYPTTILVGKDGKVVNLNIRGEKLGEALEKLLGSTKEKKAEKKTDEKN